MRKALVIFMKDLREYYLKAPVISWGILFPLTIIVLLGLNIRMFGESRVVPGMFTVSLLFASTSMAQVSISFEKMSGAINRMLFSPITSLDLVVGKALGGIFFGLVGAGVAGIAVYYITGHALLIKPLFFALGLIIGSIVFSIISILIAIFFEPIQAVAVLNIVRFSMIFLGGVLFPKVFMPKIIWPIVYVFPSVYVTETIRYGMYNEWDYVDPYTSLIVLIIILFTLIVVSFRAVIRVLTP